MAQMGAHLDGIEGVAGSNPAESTFVLHHDDPAPRGSRVIRGIGGLAERPNAPASNAGRGSAPRGFKSLALRFPWDGDTAWHEPGVALCGVATNRASRRLAQLVRARF